MKETFLNRRPRKPGIDLGLAVSALSLQPGQTRTYRELSAFCVAAGTPVSWQRIWQIEQRALRKLRAKLYADHVLQEVLKEGSGIGK